MKNIAFLFPGQGAQYVGMGKKLYDRHLFVRQIFEEASDSINVDMKKLCFEGDLGNLSKTENTQPALLTVGVAAYRALLAEIELNPNMIVGHSLGEFTALVCGNSISLSDAVKVVRLRGKLFQEAVPQNLGAMSSISGIDSTIVKEECEQVLREGGTVEISSYNTPMQTVISGYKDSVKIVAEALEKKNARVIPLKVSAPFHSRLMEPAADRLKEALLKISYKKPNITVLSNVTAAPYVTERSIPHLLTEQITRPVQWVKTMKFLKENGVNKVIDMGPNHVMKNLSFENCQNITPLSFDRDENFNQALLREIDFSSSKTKGINFIEGCLKIAICSPNYNSDTTEYENKVIQPYRRIKQLLEELESQNIEPSLENMKESIVMLCTIFRNKKTPIEEEAKRIEKLLKVTGTYNTFNNYIPKQNHEKEFQT